jgi:oligopeptide/dipeptide ABC transporter ATP-binding protein
MTEALLEVDALSLAIGAIPVVEDVGFRLAAGETMGLVGESGCGKSLTALALIRLLQPPVRITAGKIRFEGEDLAAASDARLRQIRGNRIGMIFQEPATALNPVFTIGDQIAEVLRLHRGADRRQARDRAVDLLELVALPAPASQVDRYPHQLSGGQRQRVMIAMALACEPALLIADEPTTALDVTVQADILLLLSRLQTRLGTATVLITHDLGVVAETCAHVAVMYAGRIVEAAPTAALFAHPRHRYTRALIDTIPAHTPPGRELPFIAGMVPRPGFRPPGCAFAERCTAALERCRVEAPPLVNGVACWNPVP